MSLDPRTHTRSGDKETLVAFLWANQQVLRRKIVGVSDADARRALVRSGTSLAGLIKHAAYVQASWFKVCFADTMNGVLPWPTDEFTAADDETLDILLARYDTTCAEVQQILNSSDLDDLNRGGDQPGVFTLRWITVHMIEELARHAGHADILREQLDGTTGYP